MKTYASRIESHILKKHETSRKELAELTGLSLGSISSYVSRLVKNGVLIEDDSKQTSRSRKGAGRPAIPLLLNPSLSFAIGCEIKRDAVLAEVVDIRGGKRNFLKFGGAIQDASSLLELLSRAVRRAISESPRPERVSSVGVCLPGSIDYSKGLIVHSPAVGNIRNFPLKEKLEERFGFPVVVENNARSMGFAEVHFSPAKNYRNVVFIPVDGGIGSAIILEGKIFRGGSDMGGEIGHITVENGHDAPFCSCGNRGCLQTVASCSAIARRAKELIGEGVLSCLPEKAGNVESIEFRHVVEAAAAGDKAALLAFREAAGYLASGIGTVLNLLNPELVIIGGDIAEARDYLKDSIIDFLKTRAISEVTENIVIEFSSLGENEAAYGAALLALDNVRVIPEELRRRAGSAGSPKKIKGGDAMEHGRILGNQLTREGKA